MFVLIELNTQFSFQTGSEHLGASFISTFVTAVVE